MVIIDDDDPYLVLCITNSHYDNDDYAPSASPISSSPLSSSMITMIVHPLHHQQSTPDGTIESYMKKTRIIITAIAVIITVLIIDSSSSACHDDNDDYVASPISSP